MKNQDLLQEYHALIAALSKERVAIEKRLQEINKAFGLSYEPVPSRKAGHPAGRVARARNQMSLREAVLKVLTPTPVSRQELLAAVQKAGYRFAASRPLNSLQTFLYGSGKKLIKRVGGKFAAASVPSPATPAETKKSSKPAKAKRKISPEARKRMAEAARKKSAEKK